MIEAYFESLEKMIQSFPGIQSISTNKKIYNSKQGWVVFF